MWCEIHITEPAVARLRDHGVIYKTEFHCATSDIITTSICMCFYRICFSQSFVVENVSLHFVWMWTMNWYHIWVLNALNSPLTYSSEVKCSVHTVRHNNSSIGKTTRSKTWRFSHFFFFFGVPRVEDSRTTMRTKNCAARRIKLHILNIWEFRFAHLIWNYCRSCFSISSRVNVLRELS